MTYGSTLQTTAPYAGLSGLGLDMQSILETGANLLPDGVQATGQDVIDDFKKPAEEVIRSVAGERVLEAVQASAQQGIDAVRQGAGLPPTTSGSASSQTGAAQSSETKKAEPSSAAISAAARVVTPWGIGAAVVGGGIAYAVTGRMKRPQKRGRRIAASALVGVAAGIVTGMATAR